MYWYVLFAKTGYEHKVSHEIQNVWRVDGIEPFIPMYDAKFRKSGLIISQKRKLFPGYVFIESEISSAEFWRTTRSFIYESSHTLKLLRYGGSYDENVSAAVKSEEQQTLQKLFRSSNFCAKSKDYCIDMSLGFIEGDMIKVIRGPLENHESLIKKIKRHKMEAIIEIELMGEAREITVGLEIIERI